MCSQIVLNFLVLARIGRPGILWSVDTLARAFTEWTRACEKRLARLIENIHHTCEFKQYCHVGNTAQHCRLGLIQDSDFAGDPEDSTSTSGGLLCIFGAEIISLDAGLRMDGIPALDLWDLVLEVFHSSPNQFDNTKDQTRGNSSRNTTSNNHTQNQNKVPT